MIQNGYSLTVGKTTEALTLLEGIATNRCSLLGFRRFPISGRDDPIGGIETLIIQLLDGLVGTPTEALTRSEGIDEFGWPRR